MKTILCCISLYLVTLSAQAQLVDEIRELYSEAYEFVLSEDYADALPLFMELNEMYPSLNYEYLIGFCYLNTPGSKLLSLPYLEKPYKT
ncbi:MAG: hypothetical protein HC896_10155 [Bacteroidales bacterium]|nr:hypothetical protein [Bacteroidales bacterium]